MYNIYIYMIIHGECPMATTTSLCCHHRASFGLGEGEEDSDKNRRGSRANGALEQYTAKAAELHKALLLRVPVVAGVAVSDLLPHARSVGRGSRGSRSPGEAERG